MHSLQTQVEKSIWNVACIIKESEEICRLVRDLKLGRIELNGQGNDGWLFQNGLDFPGHLHIIFRTMEKTFVAMDDWTIIEGHFRVLASFMSCSALRERFIEKCLDGHREFGCLFNYWSGGNFSWRWEKMEGFLLQLSRVLPLLQRFWQPGKMKGNVDDYLTALSLAVLDLVTVIRSAGKQEITVCCWLLSDRRPNAKRV